MAIKVNGTTVIDDSRNLVNIVSGAGATTSVSAVTAYGFLLTASNYGAYSQGMTIAGSALRWSDVNYKYGAAPSGTWQICGATDSTDRPTVWQRIS